jgi:hypothetical protein
MVSGRMSRDPAINIRLRQRTNGIGRPSEFKRAGLLEILGFKINVRPGEFVN